MKRRSGYFDLNLIPDPLKWLEERLGTLDPGGVGDAQEHRLKFLIYTYIRKVSR